MNSLFILQYVALVHFLFAYGKYNLNNITDNTSLLRQLTVPIFYKGTLDISMSHSFFLFFFWCWDQIQGLMHARQVLFH
jgi:hypothetical protein